MAKIPEKYRKRLMGLDTCRSNCRLADPPAAKGPPAGLLGYGGLTPTLSDILDSMGIRVRSRDRCSSRSFPGGKLPGQWLL